MPSLIHCSACGYVATAPTITKCPHDGTDLVNPIESDRALSAEYEVLRCIGAGGMGVIFKCQRRKDGKLVAIKMLHPHLAEDEESMSRFEIELRAVCLLSHPNIIVIHDLGVADSGVPYMVMDFVDGKDLLDTLSKEGPMAQDRFLNIFTQVCGAMAHAHERSILHRDIKPDNIMLTRNERGREVVRLMDFGIARLLTDSARGVARLTKPGQAVGSPMYMSPEQARGKEIDHRSDLYSLGLVMYETLTGMPAFQGETVYKTLVMQLTEKPKPMSAHRMGIDPRLEAIVTRLTEKAPDSRYQSMLDVQRDLELIRSW
ncbi:MAG TPA: serine/threonine-protein kinase [Oculatellaceae cyanobacterium]